MIFRSILLAAVLAVPAAAQAPEAPPPAAQVSAPAAPPKRANRLLAFYVPQILLAALALAAASEAAARARPERGRALRVFWDWTLLVSFGVCAALGLLLLFPLDRALKGTVEHAHVWAGAAATAAAVYHAVKRLKAMV